MPNDNKPRHLTAVLSGQLALPLAPENISSIPLYHVHKNLWGTILSERGEPGLGRLVNVSPDGKTYELEVLPEARFSDGRKITSREVIFSIRRLIDKQPGGHFNAKSVIDRVDEVSESALKITLRSPSSAFLFLLSIPEMGIVPPEVCDKDGHIKEFGITSGPYSVLGTPEPGRIVLKKNKFFTYHATQSPDEVTLIFRKTKEEMLQAMGTYSGDFLEAYDNTGIEAFQDLKRDSALGQKVTRPSYSVFIVANTKTLSHDQRVRVARVIGDKVSHSYQLIDSLEVRSTQILPPGTFGSLKEIPPLSSHNNADLPKRIRLATLNPNTSLAKTVIKTLENTGAMVVVVGMAGGLDGADLILCGQGMNADYPEIEFHLNMLSSWAFIPATEEDRELIDRTIYSSDLDLRKESIERVGRGLLADGRIIPLLVRAYAHLYRKDRVNLDQMTNYDGDILLWKAQVTSP